MATSALQAPGSHGQGHARLAGTHGGIDPFLSIPANVAVLFGLGYVLQYVVINRIVRAPFLYTFLITFGLNLTARF